MLVPTSLQASESEVKKHLEEEDQRWPGGLPKGGLNHVFGSLEALGRPHQTHAGGNCFPLLPSTTGVPEGGHRVITPSPGDGATLPQLHKPTFF